MTKKAQTCCFTGHRQIPEKDLAGVQARLEQTIIKLYGQGVIYYGAGGALGFDTLAAETVLRLRNSYPKLRLILVLPCKDQTRRWKAEDVSRYEDIRRQADKPYPSWALSNNNAEIRRVKERIAALTRQKELGYAGWEFDGGRVEANTAENRLQIFFEEKPDEETRSSLKSNGFRWAPSAGAWQRQLNDNAIYAAGRIDCIQPLTGEKPSELQQRVRAERQLEADSSELAYDESSPEEPDQDNGMCMS